MPTATQKHTNRLIHETSPYLLQHAHNPVDWYPWSPEAFQKAQELDKPIFLSIGYSTCYWCHVMERQCFENETIAAELNQRFVPIKVDREERPDVDQLYMLALQVLTHTGGWPMSMFLTPDLLPFYGGTYFPPTDTPGRPGFLTLLRAIHSAYHEKPDDIQSTCTQLLSILEEISHPNPPDAPLTIDLPFIDSLINRSTSDYDPAHGGFGSAPKFPRQSLLELLLTHPQLKIANCQLSIVNVPSPQSKIENHKSKIDMVLHTLDALADGGIHDHLSGAFHRYSTDDHWLVPHFEIMLYDNAMLAWLYTEAFRQTQTPRYARIARGICDFVLREMTSPQGAFYTAFDAEVDAHEGLTYLWTKNEISQLLSDHRGFPGDPAGGSRVSHGGVQGEKRGSNGGGKQLFLSVYGIANGPHFEGKYILHLPQPLATIAAQLNTTEDQLDAYLSPLRQKLYKARQKRNQPALDTKIITSWNALMIRALAHAGRTLPEPRYTHAACQAAQFLLSQHLTPEGLLRHTSTRPESFLDDYAFLIQALLEIGRGEDANSLCQQMIHQFHSKSGGFYFTPHAATDLFLRQQTATDSPLPSGNAVAAAVLLQLGRASIARKTICDFAGQLSQNAESMSALLQSAALYLQQNEPIAVSTYPTGTSKHLAPSPHETAASVLTLTPTWRNPDELHLLVTIAEGYHLNAHHTAQGLIPTKLTIADQHVAIDYPPGEEQSFAFLNSPIHVYTGTITLVIRFPTPIATPSPLLLRLSYQACDYDACLPPITKELQVLPPSAQPMAAQ